jgi:cyclomaltodextrinase
MSVPAWVKDAIFYQIFPDRFANGDASNDPTNVQPWNAPPTIWGFHGGDLQGIIQKFDYLLDLGITAIYLNPIFQATSNHRYNTSDYFSIDPKLGTLNDFRSLIEIAHRNHVRVILDGVFNHCGRGFFAFNDILENQEHSPYSEWFHIHSIPIDAYSPGKAKDYLGWWGYKSLPKFNTDNPAVRKYLLGVARYWIEQGIDGWRLDVPNEINDDTFWGEFRHTVKSINPEAYLVGEIWTSDNRWVGENHFDGLMNYPLRDHLIRFLQNDGLSAEEFVGGVESLLHVYPRENAYAMYVPLGTHDTERLMTLLQGNINLVKLAFQFQFAFPGAPAIYYGDEIGMEGEKDPASRAAFPWDRERWNAELHGWVKDLISVRKRNEALRRGDYKRVFVDTENRCFVFARTFGEQVTLAALNASADRQTLHFQVGHLGFHDGQTLHNLIGEGEYHVQGDQLTLNLPASEGVWIK